MPPGARRRPTHWARTLPFCPRSQAAAGFLGCHFGIRTNPGYCGAWWGEGEVKVWLDGDGTYPSLIGTGTEDYLGAAWCLERFTHTYQGCTAAEFAAGLFAGYRYHIPDPVWFHDGCRVAIQTIGGALRQDLPVPSASDAPYRLVSMDRNGNFIRLLEEEQPWEPDDPRIGPGDWCNFFRQDTWYATAFYYSENP